MSEPWLTIQFPQPNDPPSENRIRGQHWSRARAQLTPWRDAAAWSAMAVKRDVKQLFGTPSLVEVTLRFDKVRRRDPHNYTSTVVKAMVDGLVLARVFPDDTPEWVTVHEPSLVLCPKTMTNEYQPPLVCTISLTRREP